ncbi:hypothetical protein BTM25_47540 [Actinomadura rubteroloni]|uniref:Uncharacterized protein n=1 Tax=Actinomadura rubteroloni TaxID=1926885 RepID=A0A2P4UEY1_9ACTN|nr:hypothetical protein [Actinomadura rubteroloni]POM23599.1 hypothetical protein BTM25_47540 [Actinomadura rubteroloni]
MVTPAPGGEQGSGGFLGWLGDHRWAGISAIAGIVAIVVTILLSSSGGDNTTQGNGNTCNANGNGNTVECVPSSKAP